MPNLLERLKKRVGHLKNAHKNLKKIQTKVRKKGIKREKQRKKNEEKKVKQGDSNNAPTDIIPNEQKKPDAGSKKIKKIKKQTITKKTNKSEQKNENKKRKRSKNQEKNEKRKKRKFEGKSLAEMKGKLMSGKFRWLNEQLYTTDSRAAKNLFSEEKGLENFKTYHQGFQEQVHSWTLNPVDSIIKWIQNIGANSDIIVDSGCGEAKIAQSVKQKVYSYDLVALNKHVTIADMANLPLDDGAADIVIMCLSLMGINYVDFLQEAFRVLKKHSILKIVEVRSRFTDVDEFVALIEELGFKCTAREEPNSYFIIFEFKKMKKKACKKPKTSSECLQPCLYRKR